MSVNGAQTFTITNIGNQTVTSLAIEFSYSTPGVLSHVANLSNLSGSSSFTGSSVTVTPSGGIAPGGTRTFTVDYFYVSGPVEVYDYGNILVTPTSAAGTGVQRNSTIAFYIDGDGSGYPEGPPPPLPPGPPVQEN